MRWHLTMTLALMAACSPEEEPPWRIYPEVTPEGRLLAAPEQAVWAGIRLHAAELTGDGALDLLVETLEGELWLLPGPLEEASDMGAAFRLCSREAAPDWRDPSRPVDYTGDGVADLLLTPKGAGSARIVPGPFAQAVVPEEDGWAIDNPAGFWSIDNHGADYSGDGVADLVFEIDTVGLHGDERNEIWVSFGPFEADRDVIQPDAWWVREETHLEPFELGDIDGDGFEDMVLGHNGDDGGLRGWYGPFAGEVDFETPGFTIAHDPGEGYFNVPDTVLMLGDQDGDGASDLAGVWWRGPGTTRIYRGPLTGSIHADSHDASVHGLVEDEYLGRYALAPGDLDGDGHADLALAGTEMGWVLSPEGSLYTVGAGAVFAIPGPMQGEVPAEDEYVVVSGGEPWGAIEGGMAAIGDLDGDGADELAVGLPYHSGEFWYEERVYESGYSGSWGWSEVPGAVLLLGIDP